MSVPRFPRIRGLRQDETHRPAKRLSPLGPRLAQPPISAGVHVRRKLPIALYDPGRQEFAFWIIRLERQSRSISEGRQELSCWEIRMYASADPAVNTNQPTKKSPTNTGLFEEFGVSGWLYELTIAAVSRRKQIHSVSYRTDLTRSCPDNSDVDRALSAVLWSTLENGSSKTSPGRAVFVSV